MFGKMTFTLINFTPAVHPKNPPPPTPPKKPKKTQKQKTKKPVYNKFDQNASRVEHFWYHA